MYALARASVRACSLKGALETKLEIRIDIGITRTKRLHKALEANFEIHIYICIRGEMGENLNKALETEFEIHIYICISTCQIKQLLPNL